MLNYLDKRSQEVHRLVEKHIQMDRDRAEIITEYGVEIFMYKLEQFRSAVCREMQCRKLLRVKHSHRAASDV